MTGRNAPLTPDDMVLVPIEAIRSALPVLEKIRDLVENRADQLPQGGCEHVRLDPRLTKTEAIEGAHAARLFVEFGGARL